MALPENGLDYLLGWYRRQCDGDWEHEFGIRIATLDNPGWDLEVDLAGTDLEGRVVERSRTEPAGGGWMFVASTGQVFQALRRAGACLVPGPGLKELSHDFDG